MCALSEASAGDPVRVLMVAPSRDILGGQAVQAERLLRFWADDPDARVDFLPVNPRFPGPLFHLQRIKYVRTVTTTMLYVAKLLGSVPRYDVIHIFSASYSSFVLAPTPAILVSRLFGKKTILNYRSGEAADHLARWRRTALPTIRLVDEIVAPSGYLVDVFSQFGFEARSIGNIVQQEQFRFRDRRPLQPHFLSNRNLEPLYNIPCVLLAFQLIQRRYPEARLTLAGDGSERGALEQLARQLDLRNTQFIGRVPPERMPELCDTADIYLNSPDIDNMPGSILEAFASGLPVVSTDAGGIPYIVTDQETGLLVQRGDSVSMANCAMRLLEDEDLATRIIFSARQECEKYRWSNIRAQWLALYRQLAGRRADAGSAQPSRG